MSSKTKLSNQPLVLRYIHYLLVGLVSFILVACSGSSGTSDTENNNPTGDTNALSDLQILQAVYFDERIPEGFYHEKLPDDAYYVTSHIKNTDLLSALDRVGITAYELTSDDFSEALLWSEQSESFQSSYKQLVDNEETFLYHQFTRMDPENPDVVYRHRVLKANILDRNGVDDEYKGRMTLSDMTANDVKLVIEYLWTFTTNNNYGNAVISSDTAETADEYVHNIKQAKLNMSFNDSCDSVELYEMRYTVSKVSGFITKDEALIRVIPARRSGDSLEICTS